MNEIRLIPSKDANMSYTVDTGFRGDLQLAQCEVLSVRENQNHNIVGKVKHPDHDRNLTVEGALLNYTKEGDELVFQTTAMLRWSKGFADNK